MDRPCSLTFGESVHSHVLSCKMRFVLHNSLSQCYVVMGGSAESMKDVNHRSVTCGLWPLS
jgi:hypothetical protein